jgi:predicted component of type VI protein secretion system
MARIILNLNGQMLAEYNLSKERYTVGRLPDNDIRIDNPAVSGHHSLIINILNDSFLEDLNSTNGTYVNGKLIQKHALANGDVITIGHHQLRFVDSAADSAQEEFEKTMVIPQDQRGLEQVTALAGNGRRTHEETASASLTGSPSRLQVLSGAFAGRELVLKKPLTTLGREGIQIVAILRRGESYSMVAVERGSGKAPMVNGEAVGGGARRLNDNDVLEIAGVKMGFFAT